MYYVPMQDTNVERKETPYKRYNVRSVKDWTGIALKFHNDYWNSIQKGNSLKIITQGKFNLILNYLAAKNTKNVYVNFFSSINLAYKKSCWKNGFQVLWEIAVSSGKLGKWKTETRVW